MPQKITLKAARVNAKLTLKEASKACLVQSKYYPKIQEVYGFPVDSIIFF